MYQISHISKLFDLHTKKKPQSKNKNEHLLPVYMNVEHIDIDLRKFKVVNKLLPSKHHDELLSIINPFYYNQFNVTYFDMLQSQQELLDFLEYIPLNLQSIHKYIKYSIALITVLQRKINKHKFMTSVEFMNQYKEFTYLFINTIPLRKIMLFGIVTAHSSMQDVENNSKFKIVLNDNITCLINGVKVKEFKKLYSQKLCIKGEIRINYTDCSFYFLIDDMDLINEVQLLVFNEKVALYIERIFLKHQWNLQHTNIDEELIQMLDQWYSFSQLKYLKDIDQQCLLYIKECTKPPIFLYKSSLKLYNDLTVAIFFQLLHMFYGKIGFISLHDELRKNLKVCKMLINFLKRQHGTMSDPQFRLLFKNLQHNVIKDFDVIFELFFIKGIISSIDIIEMCELIYSKAIQYLKYTSNLTICVRLKRYLRNEEIMRFLVKHVCYNYLDLRASKDSSDAKKILKNIELNEENEELVIHIHIK